MSNSFLIKSQAFRNATLLKRDSSDICEIFKNTLQKQPKFTGKRLCQIRVFNKVAGLRPATLLKNKLYHKCFPVNFLKFLRTPFSQKSSGQLLTLFYWTSPDAASDSFRFPGCKFLKKEIPEKMFFCAFYKIFNIFWQNTSEWLLLKFICELWEFFQNTSIIQPLWEIAYFLYKLQNFNQQIKLTFHRVFSSILGKNEM